MSIGLTTRPVQLSPSYRDVALLVRGEYWLYSSGPGFETNLVLSAPQHVIISVPCCFEKFCLEWLNLVCQGRALCSDAAPSLLEGMVVVWFVPLSEDRLVCNSCLIPASARVPSLCCVPCFYSFISVVPRPMLAVFSEAAFFLITEWVWKVLGTGSSALCMPGGGHLSSHTCHWGTLFRSDDGVEAFDPVTDYTAPAQKLSWLCSESIFWGCSDSGE